MAPLPWLVLLTGQGFSQYYGFFPLPDSFFQIFPECPAGGLGRRYTVPVMQQFQRLIYFFVNHNSG